MYQAIHAFKLITCVHLKVLLRVRAWRGRTVLTSVDHCDLITRAWRRTLPKDGLDFKLVKPIQQRDISASKIARFDCYDLNYRGRMEIAHGFAQLVGSPVTPDAARSRATPLVRGGSANHGSWRKTVVNSYILTWIGNHHYNVAWDYLSIPKLQRCNRWFREWIRNSIPYLIWLLIHTRIQVKPCL